MMAKVSRVCESHNVALGRGPYLGPSAPHHARCHQTSFSTVDQKEVFSAWDPSCPLSCDKRPQTEQLETSHVYHLSVSQAQESGRGVSASGSPQTAIRVSAGLCCHLKIRLGRPTPKPTHGVGKSIPCRSAAAFCDAWALSQHGACFSEAGRARAVLARQSLT